MCRDSVVICSALRLSGLLKYGVWVLMTEKESVKRYHEANKDGIREWQENYHEDNKEVISKTRSKYYKKNRTAIRKQQTGYYVDNLEERRAYGRAYYWKKKMANKLKDLHD